MFELVIFQNNDGCNSMMVELLILQIAHLSNFKTQFSHHELECAEFVIATHIYEKPDNF